MTFDRKKAYSLPRNNFEFPDEFETKLPRDYTNLTLRIKTGQQFPAGFFGENP
jgi:hypothetical protein